MRFVDLLNERRVFANIKPDSKSAVIKHLIDLCDAEYDVIEDKEKVLEEVLEREESMTTGIGLGIAIPHTRSEYVKDFAVILATKKNGIDFDSLDDEPAHIFCLILGPKEKTKEHMGILRDISLKFQNEEIREKIIEAESPEKLISIIKQDV